MRKLKTLKRDIISIFKLFGWITLVITLIWYYNYFLKEIQIKASVDLLCGTPNYFLDSGFLKVGGGTTINDDDWNKPIINESSIVININEDLKNNIKEKVIAHEQCHKRQLLEGDYVGLTCENNRSRLVELERECKKIG